MANSWRPWEAAGTQPLSTGDVNKAINLPPPIPPTTSERPTNVTLPSIVRPPAMPGVSILNVVRLTLGITVCTAGRTLARREHRQLRIRKTQSRSHPPSSPTIHPADDPPSSTSSLCSVPQTCRTDTSRSPVSSPVQAGTTPARTDSPVTGTSTSTATSPRKIHDEEAQVRCPGGPRERREGPPLCRAAQLRPITRQDHVLLPQHPAPGV